MLNQLVNLYLSKKMGFDRGVFLYLGNAFLILQRKFCFQLMLACSKVVKIPATLSICRMGVSDTLSPIFVKVSRIG